MTDIATSVDLQSSHITVTLNGAATVLPVTATITDVVTHLGFTGKRIAVERNQEIVPKSQHTATRLAEGDVIEIVHAIGGG